MSVAVMSPRMIAVATTAVTTTVRALKIYPSSK
jgi:hypothetical protein